MRSMLLPSCAATAPASAMAASPASSFVTAEPARTGTPARSDRLLLHLLIACSPAGALLLEVQVWPDARPIHRPHPGRFLSIALRIRKSGSRDRSSGPCSCQV